MLSNFLDFVNLDGENDKKLRESLITSYENTKVPNNAFTKESVLDHGQKMQGVSMNDGFSYYKMVTSSIRQHLKDIDHNELAFLLNEFVQIYELKALKIMSKFKRNDMTIKEYELSKNDFIHGLQQFIRVLQETIVFYYNLNDITSKIPECCLFTKDNLLNFVISIVLNDKVIYQVIFDLESLYETKMEETYKSVCEQLQSLNPQDFAISSAFCLNAKTISFFSNAKTINKENILRKESKDTQKKEEDVQVSLSKSITNDSQRKESKDTQKREGESMLNSLSKSNNVIEQPPIQRSLTTVEKQYHKDSRKDSKADSSSPQKESQGNHHGRNTFKNLKKFSTNTEEGDRKDLNDSKILEKTFYSSSSYELKNNPYRNNNFSLPQRKKSESFVSIKMNNELSETNNNFVSFDASMENYYQNNNVTDLSQYHSISQIQENVNNSNINDQTKKILDNLSFSEKNIVKKISFQLDEKEKNSPKLENKTNFKPPYENSINVLKKINSIRKPLQKLKKILEVSDSIKKNIKEFYDENKLTHVKYKQLDGDDILAIFLYVLAKTNMKNMRVHLRIIEKFTTENILNSKNGYYLMVIQLCLRFLENLNPEDLKKRNEENKRNMITEKVKEWIREKRINKMMMMGTTKLKKFKDKN